MEKEKIGDKLEDAVGRALIKMGVIVEERALEELKAYAEELMRWNKAYNLVGRRIGTEGIVDLLIDAISPLMIKGLLKGKEEVLDIGSGAGLPGIPLYLMAGPFQLTLVESQRKKVTFLRHIKRTLVLEEMRIFPGRFEEMARSEDDLSRYELAFVRAVTDPLKLVRQIKPLISGGGRIVLMVGKNDSERMRKAGIELEEKAGLKIDGIRSTQRVVGKEHYLVITTKTG
jgi:16S rRNA (guanine527-N7)-methyltransferase